MQLPFDVMPKNQYYAVTISFWRVHGAHAHIYIHHGIYILNTATHKWSEESSLAFNNFSVEYVDDESKKGDNLLFSSQLQWNLCSDILSILCFRYLGYILAILLSLSYQKQQLIRKKI